MPKKSQIFLLKFTIKVAKGETWLVVCRIQIVEFPLLLFFFLQYSVLTRLSPISEIFLAGPLFLKQATSSSRLHLLLDSQCGLVQVVKGRAHQAPNNTQNEQAPQESHQRDAPCLWGFLLCGGFIATVHVWDCGVDTVLADHLVDLQNVRIGLCQVVKWRNFRFLLRLLNWVVIVLIVCLFCREKTLDISSFRLFFNFFGLIQVGY